MIVSLNFIFLHKPKSSFKMCSDVILLFSCVLPNKCKKCAYLWKLFSVFLPSQVTDLMLFLIVPFYICWGVGGSLIMQNVLTNRH